MFLRLCMEVNSRMSSAVSILKACMVLMVLKLVPSLLHTHRFWEGIIEGDQIEVAAFYLESFA